MLGKDKLMRMLYLWILFALVIIAIFSFIFRESIFNLTDRYTQWKADFKDADMVQSISYLSGMVGKLLEWNVVNNRKDMVIRYCDVLLSGKNNNDYMRSDNLFYYDPHYSIFVYNLCNYVDSESYKDKFDNLSEYASDMYVDELKYNLWFLSSCDPDSDMNSCNVPEFYGTMFKTILNDYSNLKLSNLYWFGRMELEDMIKNFSDEYFGKICWDKNAFYLDQEQREDKSDRHCTHPKTYKLLSDTIRGIIWLVTDIKTMNVNSVMEWETDKDYCSWQNFDFFKCGFMNTDMHWRWFRNIMHNELMYYNLFLTYFVYTHTVDLWMREFNVWDISVEFDKRETELTVTQKEIIVSRNAVLQTDRMLRDVYATFPIHIWLVAYYEDIERFRKVIAKIYTPFHQAYYQYRNVQDTRR